MKRVKLFLAVVEIVCIVAAPLVIIFFNCATTTGETVELDIGVPLFLYLFLVAWLIKRLFLAHFFGKNGSKFAVLRSELRRETDPASVKRLKWSIRMTDTAERLSGFLIPALVLIVLYMFGHAIEGYLIQKIGVQVFHLSATVGIIGIFVALGFACSLISAQLVEGGDHEGKH